MDPTAAISLVLTVINVATKLYPEIVTTAGNLKTFGTTLFEEFTGTKISDADLATLEAEVDDIHARLQISIPDAPPT